MDNQKRMGKDKEGVIFPVAPNLSEMGDSYLEFIEKIKTEIQKQRVSVVMNANASMICLYWNIGRAILGKQEDVNTDELVHTARSSSACFPVFSCTLSGHQCMYMD